MPELSFVLPHWLYWSGLVLFPLLAMFLFRRAKNRQASQPLSLPLGYGLLVTGGFLGIHRLYVKSKWVLAFVVLFISILFVNIEVREARNEMSGASNKIMLAKYKVERSEKALKKGKRNAAQKLEKARLSLTEAEAGLIVSNDNQVFWDRVSQGLGAMVILLILVDAVLLPKLVRQRNETELNPSDDGFHCPVVEQEHEDSREPLLFNRMVSRMNGLAGEFVAYWSLIAVVVYYYEVMARYMFNSPTNWAHEGMFLMFGMQYLLAGGFVLREGAHVRVDVIYMHFSKRGKAIVDLLTSVFFFIFMLTLMWTGWTFFMDSYEVSEVSFTEWGIQYWPIKFALPLGAFLLFMQGLAQLVKDVVVVVDPDRAELETEVRPEG